MGGNSSERRKDDRRPKVEECRCLDVNLLSRKGCLVPGRTGTVTWTEGGEPVAAVTIVAEVDCIGILYPREAPGGEVEEALEIVRIVRTVCRYGGTRPFFICPGERDGAACGRRAAKLYEAGGRFLCRLCHGLAYESQSEGEMERALRRANKIRDRLGGTSEGLPGSAAPFPNRPKGMWTRTHNLLEKANREATSKANWELSKRATKLLSNIPGYRG